MASFDLFEDLFLTGRPGLSQGDRAPYREAGPPTGILAFHREAGPLTGRLGL